MLLCCRLLDLSRMEIAWRVALRLHIASTADRRGQMLRPPCNCVGRGLALIPASRSISLEMHAAACMLSSDVETRTGSATSHGGARQSG